MAKIALTEGFTVIPEGRHIFKITDVTYKEAFGKMEVKMETAKGQKHIERFSLLDKNGNPNGGAYNAFSYFAKTALGDYDRTEIDHEELIGCYMECFVEHDVQPNKNNPEKTVTFARLAEKNPADGYDEPVTVKKTKSATTTKAPINSGDINLDDILG